MAPPPAQDLDADEEDPVALRQRRSSQSNSQDTDSVIYSDSRKRFNRTESRVEYLQLTDLVDGLHQSFHQQITNLKQDVDLRICELSRQVEHLTKMKSRLLESFKTEQNENCVGNNDELSKNSQSAFVLRKRFQPRNSLLTDLFQVRDISTIRHVFIAVMIIFAIQHLIHDIIEGDTSVFDLELISWCFHKISSVIVMWLQMKFLTVMLYIVYYSVSSYRNNHLPKRLVSYFDRTVICLYIGYLILFIVIPLKILIREKPGLVSSIIMLMEQTRMLMKQHAFVRELIPRTLQGLDCPDFSKYIYFLFAPTLIYRDDYPRNKKIRWNMVVNHLVEFIVTVLYSYYVFLRVAEPEFTAVDASSLTNIKYIAKCVYACILPGSLLLLLVFYGFFHCWLNAFGEMLRFADRLFYKDWWNSTTYKGFFRRWNTIVHDWLFNYVYLDMLSILGNNRRTLCSFIVIILSSIFHEYLFTFMFGYFYPVNLVMFGLLGFVFSVIPLPEDSKIGNILFWVSFIMGLGLNVSLCSMGYHARKLCSERIGPLWDIILPKFLICIGYNSKS